MAIFSRLLPTASSAYAVQALFALIFVPQQNEKFFDFAGSVGWLSTTFISLFYPVLKARLWQGNDVPVPNLSSFAPRQLLLTAAVGIWSIRLGTFLTKRAIKNGGDSRFDNIKVNPSRFLYYWFAQATWITVVGFPVYLCNALPSRFHPVLQTRDKIAICVYAGSLLLETIADYQKSNWRRAKAKKEHDEDFISSGLWNISRHPNYLGELGIWTGIWALSTSSLETAHFPRGTILLTALSPLFVWHLVRNVSGVPPLERAGNKKFANNAKWQLYKRTVPVFWPWGPVE